MSGSKLALTRGTFPVQTVLCGADGTLPTANFVKSIIASDTSEDFSSRIARRQLHDVIKRSKYWRTFDVFSTKLSPLEAVCIVHDGNEKLLSWRRFPRGTYEVCVLATMSLSRLLSMFACTVVLWSAFAVMQTLVSGETRSNLSSIGCDFY